MEERNMTTWRELLAAINRDDFDAMDAMVASELFSYHSIPYPWVTRYADWKKAVEAYRTSFNATRNVREIAAKGDQVWSYNILDGRHDKAWMDAEATGKPIHIEYFSIATFDDAGKIVRIETIADDLNFMIQLGVIPPLMPTHHTDKKELNQIPAGHHRDPTAVDAVVAQQAKLPVARTGEQNVQAWRDLHKALNVGDFELMDSFFDAEGFQYRNVNRTDLGSYASWKASPVAHYHAFGAQQYDRESIADGNNIWTYNIQDGVHSGPPWMGVGPTGNKLHVEWISLVRFNSEGRIYEIKTVADVLGMMTQLGVIPPVKPLQEGKGLPI